MALPLARTEPQLQRIFDDAFQEKYQSTMRKKVLNFPFIKACVRKLCLKIGRLRGFPYFRDTVTFLTHALLVANFENQYLKFQYPC